MKHLWRLTPVNFYALWEERESVGRTARRSPRRQRKGPLPGWRGSSSRGATAVSSAALGDPPPDVRRSQVSLCRRGVLVHGVSSRPDTLSGFTCQRTNKLHHPPSAALTWPLTQLYRNTVRVYFTVSCRQVEVLHPSEVYFNAMSLEAILRHLYPCSEEVPFILLYTNFMPPPVHNVTLLVVANNSIL